MELEEAIKNCNSIVYFCENNKECQENEFCPDCYIEIEDVKAIKTILQALDNSIPKKKVENKIKELNEKGNYKTKNNPNGRVHFHVEPCDYQIQILQELLEEK